MSVEDLAGFREVIVTAHKRCIDGEKEFNPSEKGCKWCRVKAQCPALSEMVEDVTGVDFKDLDAPPTAITALTYTEVADRMKKVNIIKTWCSAVESWLVDEIKSGSTFKDWKLVEGRSIRKWGADEDAVKAILKKKLKKAEYLTEKIISPTQAEKLLKANKCQKPFIEEVQNIVVKPEGKPALALKTDKRPALSFNEFKNLDN